MKILVLTSRYTALRDIIEEDFGRQTRLFASLTKLDNEIDFFCVDYKKKEHKDTKLHGMNIFIRPFTPYNPLSHRKLYKQLKKQLKQKYDLIIATSDPLWGVFAHKAAKATHTKFLYDLHDNYEVYQTYKLPFFKYIDHRIIKSADIVTTVSHTLKDYISKWRKNNVHVIQNGVDTELFKELRQSSARTALKLPQKPKIIAYAGSLQKQQGIHILIEAFEQLQKEFPDLILFLAGRIRKEKSEDLEIQHKGIIYKENLNQKGVVQVINAADIVVIPNTENAFTKYCFPYKCVEYMACNTPIVATNVGDVGIFLKQFPHTLCEPDNVDDLKEKLKYKLTHEEKIDYRKHIKKNTWDAIAKELDTIIKSS